VRRRDDEVAASLLLPRLLRPLSRSGGHCAPRWCQHARNVRRCRS